MTSWYLEKATDKNTVHHPVCIVPAPFCAMREMNDGRYSPRDVSSESDNLRMERENNVEF